MDDLSSIISAMLIRKYTPGERSAFSFLHAHCTASRKLPREWKCLMAYHRLAWNIFSLTPKVDRVEGWQVQLIAWIFVCWEWRDLITILIQKWNKLELFRNWKLEKGPSLREIVEHYIDERWKKSATQTTDDATEEVEKPMPEENITLEDMKEVLRNVLKEQKEMRNMLKMIIKKNYKEEEDTEGEIQLQQATTGKENKRKIINKIFMEEEDMEGESSLQLYTMAEENQQTKKEKNEEEREEWNRLRDTLRRYNVKMDAIKVFQKFRFYCQPGHLPWPLPKQD